MTFYISFFGRDSPWIHVDSGRVALLGDICSSFILAEIVSIKSIVPLFNMK